MPKRHLYWGVLVALLMTLVFIDPLLAACSKVKGRAFSSCSTRQDAHCGDSPCVVLTCKEGLHEFCSLFPKLRYHCDGTETCVFPEPPCSPYVDYCGSILSCSEDDIGDQCPCTCPIDP